MKKLNYGKYALITPVKYLFKKEQDMYWIIKPPTSGDELALTQFLMADRVFVLPGGATVSRPAVNLEVAHREIALTFGGTNLAYEDGENVLTEKSTVEEVEAVLRNLPHEMVMEIWNAISESIPGWGPAKKKVEVIPGEKSESDPKN